MVLASFTVHTSFASVQNRTLITTAPQSSAIRKNREYVQFSATWQCSQGCVRSRNLPSAHGLSHREAPRAMVSGSTAALIQS